MFVDGRRVARDENITTDICIVGAGAAGLTLAQALDRSGLSILLVDSGGLKEDSSTQSLNQGISSFPDYPFQSSRVRRFGGTTGRWSGVCIPLDQADFAQRSWLPHSGWPISLADLEPYYEKAQPIFGLPPVSAAEPPAQNNPFNSFPLATKVLLHSNPLDLGIKFQRQIERSQSITTLLHASVTQLHLDAARQTIDRLDVQCLSGTRFTLRARVVILATGGIENARLLLASNTEAPAGIGNQHDTVGRYHMEHPIPVVGVLPTGPHYRDTLYFTNRNPCGTSEAQGTFGLAPEIRAREHLLDAHIRLYRYNLLEDTMAVVAAKALPPRLRDGPRREAAAQFWPHLRSNLLNVLLPYVRWHVWNKINRRARFDHVRLMALVEQEPDPANRITLSELQGPFGRPLPHLSFCLSDTMEESLIRSLRLVDKALQARGFGPLRTDREAIAHLKPYIRYGLHHMGSTRMGTNPQNSVVDENCRVHGVANLYIAGSSVFATGGAANPTLTIAALALRLVDHVTAIWQ